MHKKKLYILDVSGYIFRAYFALPPMSNAVGEPTHALFGFIRSVIKLLQDLAPEYIVAVFDGPDNKAQRKEIYEKYKANRTQSYPDLPQQIDKAKIFCELMGISCLEESGVEADDTMGSVAKWAMPNYDEIYLCTSDKDLCQLVKENIFVLNPWKENLIIDAATVEQLYGVPPAQMVDLLAIVGDSSDNIPGIKGLGPKTTVPLLQKYGSLQNLLKHTPELSKKKQLLIEEGKDKALLSLRLATIHADVDFSKKEAPFAKKQPELARLLDFYTANNFNSLAKTLSEEVNEVVEAPASYYHLVDTEKELEELIGQLKKAACIAFDTETTDLRAMRAELVGIGFAIRENEAFYVPCNGHLGIEMVLTHLKPLFEDSSLHFFAHNAKYDLHVLQNVGIKVASIVFDTILASYLLNSASRQHALDNLALYHFGKVKIPIKSLIGSGKKEISMKEVAVEKVCAYCCEDVDYTFRLKNLFEKQLQERNLNSLLFDVELPLMHVLMQMERTGIYVDTDLLATMGIKIQKQISHLVHEIYELAGEKFNISSPQQLSRILFEKLLIRPSKKTTTGFSTSAEVLTELALNYPIAEKVLEYRTLEKLRSTYIEVLPQEVNPNTYRIHTTFNQSVAATGRLSCQDPNLQNIPVRSAAGRAIRTAFCVQKSDYCFVAADYSQMELRLLAHVSGDESLLEAFRKGEDIHAFTASLMFNVPLQQVSKEERSLAKAINFGIIYGQQAYGLSQSLGIPLQEASRFIDAYFVRYPRVKSCIQHLIEEGRKKGKSTTLIGRERLLSDIKSPNQQARAAAERLAINTPLQGTAADIIKLAMIEIAKRLENNKMQSKMILQIHDELLFEAPLSESASLSNMVKEVMEGIVELKVPLVVNILIGKNWSEC